MSEKVYLKRRKFLNEDTGLAAIDLQVTSNEEWVSATCSISDCARSVSLDFDSFDGADQDQRIAKIDILIRAFQDLRSALVLADADRRVYIALKKPKDEDQGEAA